MGLICGALVLLVFGANWLVDAAVSFARMLGLSEMVIGLTISRSPEVATSLVPSVRGERDIAVGNVVGKNIFNILGVSSLFAPLPQLFRCEQLCRALI